MRSAVPAFSVTTVIWLLAAGLASFAATVLLAVFGADLMPLRSPAAHAWSVSAIGHRAFVETLRGLDAPVIIGRHRPADTAGTAGLLVVAAPAIEHADQIDLAGAARTLVVLPKWTGSGNPDKPQWLQTATLLTADAVTTVARHIVADARIVRVAGPVPWRAGRFGADPDLPRPQLLRSARLRPLIAGEAGMLLGELTDAAAGDARRIWVLSDPDLIANHGLGRGTNAAIAVAIIEALRPAGGPVVFDATVHGFARPPDLWRELFSLPLLLVTLQALVAAAILVWCAAGRFGAPEPPPGPLKGGRGALIDSAAGLLAMGGHLRPLVRRYSEVTIRDVARRLHAPRTLDDAGTAQWLQRVGEMRGLDPGEAQLPTHAAAVIDARRTDPHHLLDITRRLHQWKHQVLGDATGKSGLAIPPKSR